MNLYAYSGSLLSLLPKDLQELIQKAVNILEHEIIKPPTKEDSIYLKNNSERLSTIHSEGSYCSIVQYYIPEGICNGFRVAYEEDKSKFKNYDISYCNFPENLKCGTNIKNSGCYLGKDIQATAGFIDIYSMFLLIRKRLIEYDIENPKEHAITKTQDFMETVFDYYTTKNRSAFLEVYLFLSITELNYTEIFDDNRDEVDIYNTCVDHYNKLLDMIEDFE